MAWDWEKKQDNVQVQMFIKSTSTVGKRCDYTRQCNIITNSVTDDEVNTQTTVKTPVLYIMNIKI